MLDATCSAVGSVTAEGQLVPEAEVLSQGKQVSSGILFIEQDKARYLTSSATDIQTTIAKVESVIDDLNSSLTKIGAGMTGSSTAAPPTLATDLAVITSKVTSLTATKAALDTLKGALK